MHQSDDVNDRLDQIQRELLERECVDRASCYLPANDMTSHFEQLERFNACMAQSKAANDERVQKLTTHRLTQILEVQERIAKVVETLVERSKPLVYNLSPDKHTPLSERISERAKARYTPPQPKTRSAFLRFTLDELEYIEGWYENALHTDMTLTQEDRAIVSKIQDAIRKIQEDTPQLWD